MRLNENIAISTPKVLLVPYDAHHVLRYHEWMQDPAIREATASEQLTLDEEYENQLSWRTSHDKLTFIVCRPRATPTDGSEPAPVEGGNARADGEEEVHAGAADAPARMVGDVNLFLTPWEGDEREEENGAGAEGGGGGARFCAGEVDIMIADPADRGRGAGRAAVAALLAFVRRNLGAVLGEYAGAGAESGVGLRELVVKIKAGNEGSIALFGGLGFRRRGEVNYFGEIQMVLEGFGDGDVDGGGEVEGYRECVYDRSRLGQGE